MSHDKLCVPCPSSFSIIHGFTHGYGASPRSPPVDRRSLFCHSHTRFAASNSSDLWPICDTSAPSMSSLHSDTNRLHCDGFDLPGRRLCQSDSPIFFAQTHVLLVPTFFGAEDYGCASRRACFPDVCSYKFCPLFLTCVFSVII